jgi:DNA-binding response OmpR family regulator
MKILVIDDDALILKSLSQCLGEAGHTVVTARNGSEANDLIETDTHRPDLIICDLLMPEISGLTFISLLRNFHNYSIPLIVISSLQQGDLLTEHVGITDFEFISKPFTMDEVLGKVEKYRVGRIES